MTIAWVPDVAEREHVGPLPASLDVRPLPADWRADPDRDQVVALVPPTGDAALQRELLGGLPALRLVQSLSAGVDALLPALPAGVTLCSARGARDGAVAEWALAAILAHAKRLLPALEQQRERRWERLEAGDVAGARVVIAGHGSIGEALARMLEALGAEVIAVARRARPGVHAIDALDGLLPRADVLVALLPLTPQTRGLLDRRRLALLPDGALVVNAGRGPTLDTTALLAELERGRLRAALDVVAPEPLPPDHPLWNAPGLLLTPHVAGSTPGATVAAWRLAGRQLTRFAQDEPLRNVVAGP